MPLDESAILAVLDSAAASEDDYPMPWRGLRAWVGHFEPHAMRLIAARRGVVTTGESSSRSSKATSSKGLTTTSATIQQYRYGSRVPSGGRYLEDARPIDMHRVVPPTLGRGDYAGVEVVGPKGTQRLTLTDALVRELRPGKGPTHIEDWPSVLATDTFNHTEGPPSASKTYQSLAKALVLRDPSVFVGGRPNVGFARA